MYASEEPSKWRRIAEIVSWVLLFVVVFPGTTLGYFAENSLPNTPLYPVKTGIEKVILTLTSVNNSAKTTYQLELARIRVNETKQLFASNKPLTAKDIEQLDIVAAQLDDTQIAIANVSDPVQKQQLQQQLTSTAQSYKEQLSTLKQQLNSVTSNAPTNRGAITPTIVQTTNPTTPVTSNTQNSAPPQDNSQAPNSPNNSSSTSSDNTASNLSSLSNENVDLLQQTIDNVNTQLDTLTSPPPPPSFDHPQSPGVVPAFTPAPLPTATPVPFFLFHHNGNNSHTDKNSQDNR